MNLIHSIIRIFATSIIFAFFLYLFQFCQSNEKPLQKDKPTETMNSGKLKVYIEDGLAGLLQTPLEWYRKDYPKVALNTEIVSSRQAMKMLLGGVSRVIVISRDYLKDEDSLMKQYNVQPHYREPLAEDALVLFTLPNFPIDTINDEQLHSILTERQTGFRNIFSNTNFSKEPRFIIASNNSSEYANFEKLIVRGKPIAFKLELVNTSDSVKKLIKNSLTNIGICYLSQVVKDTGFKLIRIGYTDSTGKYIRPKPVHQGYIVQGLYPYRIIHWVYLLEDRRDLAFWFAKFLAVEEKVQKYFLNSGIVPAFAKIKLIPEEQ